MIDVIECGGAPRDMGLSQGKSLAEAVRRHLEGRDPRGPRRLAGLRAFASGGVLGNGMAREIIRHYPHLAERMTGIARGAGVAFETLMDTFVRDASGLEATPQDPARSPALAVAAPAALRETGERPGSCALVRSFDAGPEGAWLLRRSLPEIGFASIDLTLPWLATAVAGVNVSGLAVAVAASDGRLAGAARAPDCWLLVQECLQRFEEVEPALDWCLKRPVSGAGALVLADRSGECASVSIDPDGRRVEPAHAGIAIAGADAEQQAVLRKRCAEPAGLDVTAVVELAETNDLVRLDCAAAELRFDDRRFAAAGN